MSEKGKKEEERRENEPEMVVFIPHTPNGELKERLQEEDMKMVNHLKVKRVEVRRERRKKHRRDLVQEQSLEGEEMWG